MTRKEYEAHLEEVGAVLTRSTIECDKWTIGKAVILVYPTYATCGGKEVWKAC